MAALLFSKNFLLNHSIKNLHIHPTNHQGLPHPNNPFSSLVLRLSRTNGEPFETFALSPFLQVHNPGTFLPRLLFLRQIHRQVPLMHHNSCTSLPSPQIHPKRSYIRHRQDFPPIFLLLQYFQNLCWIPPQLHHPVQNFYCMTRRKLGSKPSINKPTFS